MLAFFPSKIAYFRSGEKNTCLTLSEIGNFRAEISDERFWDENPGGNGSNFRQDFHRKSLVGNRLSLIAPHNIVLLFKEKSEHLSIPQSGGKNVKTLRWDDRLQIQNLFVAFKLVPLW